MLKEKGKPAGPARARGPRGRKQPLGEAEETADPELKAACVETCRGHLRSILTHWGPAVPDPESEAPHPVYAAGILVVRWVLRAAVGRPLSRTEAAGLVGWLRNRILPHRALVAGLLGDSTVRSHLFLLYSRLCSAEGLAGPTQDVACLFTSLMLQLVAARDTVGSTLHTEVEALCASCLQEDLDEATRGTAGSQRRREGLGQGPARPGLGTSATQSFAALCQKPPLVPCPGGPSHFSVVQPASRMALAESWGGRGLPQRETGTAHACVFWPLPACSCPKHGCNPAHRIRPSSLPPGTSR